MMPGPNGLLLPGPQPQPQALMVTSPLNDVQLLALLAGMQGSGVSVDQALERAVGIFAGAIRAVRGEEIQKRLQEEE